MRKSLFTLLACLTVLLAQAQVGTKVERADEKYANLAFSEALDLYQSAFDADKGDKDYLAIKIANCYRLLGDATASEQWFAKAANSSSADPINYLYYAQTLAQNAKYDEAKAWFEKFLTRFPDDQRGILGIESCDQAQNISTIESAYTVSNTNLNSKFSDFSPVASPEGLVFASNRRNPITIGYTDQWTGGNYLDLYIAKNDGQGSFSKPVLMKGKTNAMYHESNATYSPDGKTMVFTRSQHTPGLLGGSVVKSTIDNVVKLKLMIATYDEASQKWGTPEEFAYNNADYSYAHPAFSADGKTLFFASDRPGGYGGTDIWKSTLAADGSYGLPENLGVAVNTAGQEMFPFVDGSNALYFASNGLAGLGGLDVFRARIDENGKVTGPANLGTPINTTADDFGFSFNPVSNIGFVSSNRRGGEGSDDIYTFTFTGVFAELLVLDGANGEPIKGAKVVRDGVVYGVSNANGVVSNVLQVDQSYTFDVSADKYQPTKTTLSTASQPIGATVKKTVYLYQSNGSVANGLVIEEKSQFPVNGVTVTLTNNVTGETKTMTTDNTGQYEMEIYPGTEYTVKAEKEGYDADEYTFSTTDMPANTEKTRNLVLKNGEFICNIEFYNIYFDFDRANIRQDASSDLQKMYEILEGSDRLRVEVAAHTDCRGTEEYNMDLSQRRAQSTVDWLVEKGIDVSRIIPKGYGETELKNECTCDGAECDDAKHQANRRVEFKLINEDNVVICESKAK